MDLLIINYHYVNDNKYKNGIYPVSKNKFKDQISSLSRKREFIGQNELFRILNSKNKTKRKLCMITFDDNLIDHYYCFNFLKQKNIPAVFFSTTMPYLKNEVHDVHKLQFIRSKISDNYIINYLTRFFNYSNVEFDNKIISSEYRYDKLEVSKMKYYFNFIIDQRKKRSILNSLLNEIEVSEEALHKNLYMDKKNLNDIASEDMLGCHTHNHFNLKKMCEKDILIDLKKSIKILKNITNLKEIKSISYPFGGIDSIDTKVLSVSKFCGFQLGFNMNREINKKNINPLNLNRIDTNDLNLFL